MPTKPANLQVTVEYSTRKWQAPLNDKKKASVEEIPEDPVPSDPPWNPWNILEASDGSDDDLESLPMSAPMEVDSDEDTVKIIEEPEEDGEAELGLWLLSTFKHQDWFCHRAHVQEMDLTCLCVL